MYVFQKCVSLSTKKDTIVENETTAIDESSAVPMDVSVPENPASASEYSGQAVMDSPEVVASAEVEVTDVASAEEIPAESEQRIFKQTGISIDRRGLCQF